MIRALVFDCFGVLYASPFAIFAGKYIKSSDHQAYEDLYKQYDHGFIDHSAFVNGQALLAGIDVSQAETELFGSFRIDSELLVKLRKLKSSYMLGMLTNISPETWQVIEPNFAGIFDVEMPSFQSQLPKPHIEAYANMAKALELDVSECVMVDDRADNCDGAQAAGMQIIRYRNLPQFEKDLQVLLNKD